ncbi:MAG: ParA family protein [Rhodobacterales bacterium]|jgi:chromosome partitioning protein
MPNDDMKVIAVLTRKGGAGKTTLARALISAAMRRGKRCLVLDADPQQALHRWATKLKISDPLFRIEALTTTGELAAKTDEAWEDGKTDFIIIDTLGAGGAWADDIAEASDALVIPMMLSADDMEITKDTYNWYVELKDRTEDPENLPSLSVVLSAVPPKPSKAESEVEQEALENFPVIDEYFMSRKQHRDASQTGFLHQIARDRRKSRNPLMRHHAKYFEEALDEADAILDQIVKAAS